MIPPPPRRDPRRARHTAALVAAIAILAACRTKHEIDVKPTQHTVKIEPIYMTVDVNLRVQKELDEFYEDIEGSSPPPSGGAPREEGARS